MASETWGSRPSHFMIIPNTKRHPNNTKTDQLPVLKVIAGLPRPYLHTTMSSAFGGKNISNEASTRLACKQADATDALLEEHRQEAQIPEPVGTLGVAALLRVALRPQGINRAASTGTPLPMATRTRWTLTSNISRPPDKWCPLCSTFRPVFVSTNCRAANLPPTAVRYLHPRPRRTRTKRKSQLLPRRATQPM